MAASPSITRQLVWLSGVGVAMFVFALFIMPPIYRVFCEITGLNGKPSAMAAGETPGVVSDRTVTVEFVTSVDAGLPWQFAGDRRVMTVRPGQINQVSFHVVNEAGEAVTGRAIPSVAPAAGAAHVKKTQCFCFEEQTLQAGQRLDMPLIFYIDPDLPRHVRTVTLAYRFYRQADQAPTL